MAIIDILVEYLKTEILNLANSAVGYLPKLAAALVIILIGARLAKYAVSYSGPVVSRSLRRPAVINITLRSIRYTVLLAAILVALSTLGINLAPLLATAGIAGIIIGVAVAPVISGYLAGIFLVVDRPYEVGDRIEIKDIGISGYVTEIGFRVTRIMTVEGNLVVIPNSIVVTKNVINYSADDIRTRKELPIGIAYESDLNKAIEIMINAANETEGIIKEGYKGMSGIEYTLEPQVYVTGYGESSLNLVLRVWLKDPHYTSRRISDIYKKIFEEFNKNNIELPYPHRDLVVKEDVFKNIKDIK